MFNRITLISLIIITGIFYKGVAQVPDIETHIDTNRISIGDQVHLYYSIKKNIRQEITLPKFANVLTDGVEIVGEPEIDSVKENKDIQEVTIDLLITSFDTGIYYLPPQPVLVPLGDFTDTIYSRATYLEVYGVAIDTTGVIRDIKPAQSAPISLMETLPYLIPISIVAIAILALLLFYRKKRLEKEEPQQARVTEPPYVTAFRELDKIKAQKLWQQEKIKEYYTQITYIIRWYISKMFNIHALELTTDEILTKLKYLKLERINYEILEGLLNLADLVKFAKGKPDPDENIKHLDNAFDFIKTTKELFVKDTETDNEKKTVN